MPTLDLLYATNRKHEGADRWHPTGYGTSFSDDGLENLRFGRVTLPVDDPTWKAQLAPLLTQVVEDCGRGDGDALSGALAPLVSGATIEPFPETVVPTVSEVRQPQAKLGSQAMFDDLRQTMQKKTDVVVFIHGFNVSWVDAVASALSLQLMLNRKGVGDPQQQARVVLFTWPSDGKMVPWVSYKADRSEAQASGAAFGRALLKLRDYLTKLGPDADCGQDIHLLCHSMGNYVLQNTIDRLDQFTPGSVLPRLFEQIFLCAADVDDTVLEPGQPMGRLHELARGVTLYHNRDDKALVISDYTKGNPERLGSTGASRPAVLPTKVQQVDCTSVVHGLAQHSYYLAGSINADVLLTVDGVALEDKRRRRERHPTLPNVWTMQPVRS